MADEDEPKTAYELILERLKQKDRAEGVSERPLTEKQKAKIAELRKLPDPEALEQLEQEYRRDRERIVSERDRKIEEIREG